MIDTLSVLILLLLLALLVWQLWRGPLTRRWRPLWLLVALAFAALLLRPLWPQPQRELVVLSTGVEASAGQAATATMPEAEVLSLPTPLTAATLHTLQQQWTREGGAQIHLFGDGLPEAAWQALPPATVIWQPSAAPLWQLQLPNRIRLGDALVIDLQAPTPAAVVQVLDAAEQLLADSTLVDQRASLRLSPAATGQYDWLLRIRDADGALLREAPLSFSVEPVQTRTFVGQFAAPSFEQRALRDWLQQTGMRGEFLTQTGQHVQRRDRFNSDDSTAFDDAVRLYDLRSWLALTAGAQQKRLAAVRAGATLVLLADGSENDETARKQLASMLAITWESLPEPLRAFNQNEVMLQRAAWLPAANARWRQHSERAVLQRDEQAGRVIWIGVQDSHRLWQRDRAAYAALWQQLLSWPAPSDLRWREPDVLLRNQPGLLCLDEAYSEPTVGVVPAAEAQRAQEMRAVVAQADAEKSGADKNATDAGTAKPVAMQPIAALQLRSPSQQPLLLPLQKTAWPGRVCAAFTPTETGWFQLEAPLSLAFRVHAQAPWPETLQQATQQATARHSQRLPPPLPQTWQPVSDAWAFMLLVAALALIWWRERLLRR